MRSVGWLGSSCCRTTPGAKQEFSEQKIEEGRMIFLERAFFVGRRGR
jgi:hypothetical protein